MRTINFIMVGVFLLTVGFANIASADIFEILAFGDSITQGLKRYSNGNIYGIETPQNGGLTKDGYEPELEEDFADQSNHTALVYNWGVAGERTDQGVNRIDIVLNSRNADIILIMEGANDLYNGISATTTKTNLRIMVERSQYNNTEPILATVTPNTDRYDGYKIPDIYNPEIKALASQKNITLADQFAALDANWSGYHSGDGLHLNETGEKVMAQTWFDAILNAGLLDYGAAPEAPGNLRIIQVN